MALITGLPNFYNNATPTATDFNNAAKAIGSQIGAMYWDPAQNKYAQSTGKLDSTNLVANPGFRSSQKAESFSHFSVTYAIYTPGSPTSTQYMSVFTPVVFPPFGIPYYITSLHLAGGGRANAVNSQTYFAQATSQSLPTSITLLVNDSPALSVACGTLPETSAILPIHFPVGSVPVGPTDLVTIDIGNLNIQGLVTGGAGAQNALTLSMICKAPHVRGNGA